MSRTVTALYDTRAEAEAARQRLAAEVELGSARILDQQSQSTGGRDGSLSRLPLSHEDRSTFHEGIRRGGFLLTAEVTSHEAADKIIRLLEESASVDLDRRQEQWRSDGWTPGQPSQRSASQTSEQVIPIVQEDLVVGRREVERGGARVRSYVREVPVHEEVTLRDEHVKVDRRPLDQPLGAAGLNSDLLRERNVEVTARGEEVVVSKEARVREQVVVSKTEERRMQPIESQVARTEVAVEEGRGQRLITGGDTTDSRIPPAGPTSFAGGGHAPMAPPPVPEQYAVEDVRPLHQPQAETVVTERRRTTSRPSTAVIVGSAVAGAIAGGVIPFMLAGRKTSRRSETLLIEDHSPSTRVTVPVDRFPQGGRRY